MQACQLLCSRAISQTNVLELNHLLVCFCKKYEELYGASACTPNLHLHCHLKECLLDFGPANAFWLFACERLNGILGAISTNHHSIEAQLMMKFSSSQQALQSIAKSESSEVEMLLSPFHFSKGSLRYDELPEIPVLTQISICNVEEFSEQCRLLPCVKESCFLSDEHMDIETTLKHYFGSDYVRTLLLHKYSYAAQFNGELYGAKNYVHSSSSLILARTNNTTFKIIPGFVSKYVVVDAFLKINGIQRHQKIYLALINWLSEHEHRHWFPRPVEVWRVFSPCAGSCFIPVSNILCRCAHLTEVIQFDRVMKESVTITVPLNHFDGL